MGTDSILFSYPIASGDLRYIEVNTREIHLVGQAESGYLIRGEIPGCGPGCDINLSQILLEFSVSCEGCRDLEAAQETVTQFGKHLAEILAPHFSNATSGGSVNDQIHFAFECLLNSLEVDHAALRAEDRFQFTLQKCPFKSSADQSGFARGLNLAYSGFGALCQSSLFLIAPDWRLHYSPDCDQEDGLLEFVLTKESDR
jgi:hypothetical protein